MDREHSEASHAADELEDVPVQLGGSSTDTDVKVVVRVRPTVSQERQPGAHMCVEHVGFNSLIIRTPTEAHGMVFNWVAGQATTQNEFFKVVGRPTVESCLSGFNSCIFAYGQTGSGKTHTMIGELPENTDVLPPDAGLIPRIFQYLWRRMPEVQASMLEHSASKAAAAAASQASSNDAECLDDQTSCSSSSSGGSAAVPSLTWLVRCSMLEIHKEEITDLLRPNSGSLNLREDIRKGVYVEGLVEKVVDNVQSLLTVLRTGIDIRQTGSTELNAASSRSHCVFTCHVESRLEAQPGLVNVRSSRLHMVDLAGSERLRYGQGGMGQGEGSGQLLKETTSINTSLSVLGLVILKLTENQPHIPYRNSKLTFLLQDSIGGNAKTIIIANISPSDQCLQETLSTLKFATRARKLVNKAVINEDTNGDAAVLRAENKRLQQELALAHHVIRAGGPGAAAGQLAAAVQLQEQQVQVQQALCLLSELDGRATMLQEALEYSRMERSELEKRCLEDRQEIAALHVTLSQKEKEARAWRHKWFKLDKVAQSSRSSLDPTAAAASVDDEAAVIAPAAQAAAAIQQPNTRAETPRHLCSSRQANRTTERVEDRQTSEVLNLLSTHLSQLVTSVCPTPLPAAADGHDVFEQPSDTRPAVPASKFQESLSELRAACRPCLHEVPELGSILGSLELLSDWQQRMSTPEPASHPDADCQLAAQGAVSGIPKANFVPIELHRQLEEERQLTTQLQNQVRKLQQQLGMAAEKSPKGAISKSCSSIASNTDAGEVMAGGEVEAPLHTVFCTSTDSVLRGSTVALQPTAVQQQQHEPVVLQLRIYVTDTAAEGANSWPAPARVSQMPVTGPSSTDPSAGKTTSLLQRLAALQEQLDMVTREKDALQGRMATARNALAAARCSTPSSLNSSRLPSPQSCFSPLRPFFGESIDEEEEENAAGLTGPSGWHRRSSPSGRDSPSTPVKLVSPATSSHVPEAGRDDHDSLSHDQVWQQHHTEWQQHQQEMQKRQQLTRAVHAAIKGVAGKEQQERHATSSPSPNGKPPLSPVRPALVSEHSSAERLQIGNQTRDLAAQHNMRRSNSGLELLQQQQTLPRLQLPHRWGTGIRGSGGDLASFIHSFKLEIQQLLQETERDVQPQQSQQLTQENALQSAADALQKGAMTVSPAAEGIAARPGRPICSQGSMNLRNSSDSLAPASTPSAAATNPAVDETTAAAEVGEDGLEINNSIQQQHGDEQGVPAWEMADYEEEFQQLRQQLEELVNANSSLKAALQQRDSALMDKEALLDQQGHELECTESILQELQERLALSEAQRAAAATEHCDAIWAKGQVAGLRDLNEQLQMQLELQGQEVAELKAALERLMSAETAPVVAEAFTAASAAYLEEPSAAGTTSNTTAVPIAGQEDAQGAASITADKDACQAGVEVALHEYALEADHNRPALQHQQQFVHLQQEGMAGDDKTATQEVCASDPGTVAIAEFGVVQSTPPLATDSVAAAGETQQGEKAVIAPAAAELALIQAEHSQDSAALHAQAASTPNSATECTSAALVELIQTAAVPAAATVASVARDPVQPQFAQEAAATAAPLQSLSVARKLRMHTSKLSAQPSNLEIAAEQAILLRHQLEAVGLQLQQKQLEAKLAQVKMQMDRLQQHHKVQLQQQQLQLQRYQRHSANLQQEVLNAATPKKQIMCHGGIGSDAGSVLSGLHAATTGARLRPGRYNTWSPGRSPARSPVGAFLLLRSPMDNGSFKAAMAAGGQAGENAGAGKHIPASNEEESNSSSTGTKQDWPHPVHSSNNVDTPAAPEVFNSGATAACETKLGDKHIADAAADAADAVESPAVVLPETNKVQLADVTHAVECVAHSVSSCSSRCSDGSDSSSLGQCQDELADLLAQLHALARDTHETSTFKAASASTLTPLASKAVAGAKEYWPSAGAAQVQTKLQVASAFELEATRGLMHAGAAVLELQNELNTAEKQRKGRARNKHGKHEHVRETSPLARSLLSKFNVAVPDDDIAAEESATASAPHLASQAAAACNMRSAAGNDQAPLTLRQQQQHLSQQKLLVVLETLAQQQQHLMQVLSDPADTSISALSEPTAASDVGSKRTTHLEQLAAAYVPELHKVQQQLLIQLRQAQAALEGSEAVRQVQQQTLLQPGDNASSSYQHEQPVQAAEQQQGRGQSSQSIAVTEANSTQLELGDGADTPKAELTAAAAAANAAAGACNAGGSRSPTRRHRSKQRELLRMSQESMQQQGCSNENDQQQLRDSCKEGRLQQFIRGAKANDSLLHGVLVTSSWDAGCQTEEHGVAAAGSANDAAVDVQSKERVLPAPQLRIAVPGHDSDATTGAHQKEPELVMELRGEIAKLQLQLHELKVRAQVAEDLRHRVLQHLPRSHSSCSSRGEAESSEGAALVRSSVDGAVASLGAAVQRPPLLPPGLFSPRGASVAAILLTTTPVIGSGSFAASGTLGSPGNSAVTAGTTTAAVAAAAAGTPNAVFSLTGQVQYLQSRCLGQHHQITQLKDQLQRQEMMLRQQHLPPAAFSSMSSSAGVPSGGSTARGLHGSGSSSMFSPRLGGGAGSGVSGMFSPRVAQGSGVSGLFSPRVMHAPVRPQPGEQYSSPSSPGAVGMEGCGMSSPSKAAKSPLGVMAMATGEARGGEGRGLNAVPEHSVLDKKLSGSNRRQSLGSSTGKGLKVAMPGGRKMRLAAVKGSMRWHTMG